MKDWLDKRLAICALLSLFAHFTLARGLEHLSPHAEPKPPERVEVRVIEPPPPPPEEPKPEEPKPEPKPMPHEQPKAQPYHPPAVATVASDSPAPDHPAFQQDTSEEPVYGVNMNSVSTVGTGPAVPVGNTLQPAAQGSASQVKPLAAPIAAAEATKLPLPEARCFGKYTEEAHSAGVEGTVVIDLIVGEDGRARDIEVREGLGAGLTEAAIKALKDCRFTPGEREGKRVPVKIRGFKVHFVRPD
jgi:protein TonB